MSKIVVWKMIKKTILTGLNFFTTYSIEETFMKKIRRNLQEIKNGFNFFLQFHL